MSGAQKNIPTQIENSSVLKDSIASIKQCWNQGWDAIVSAKREVEGSEALKTAKEYKSSFDNEVGSPLMEVYRSLPSKMTEEKFNVIRAYSYNERFVVINLACVLVALGTFGKMRDANLLSKSFRAFRNSGVFYLGGGLFITPEIYNPLMKNE